MPPEGLSVAPSPLTTQLPFGLSHTFPTTHVAPPSLLWPLNREAVAMPAMHVPGMVSSSELPRGATLAAHESPTSHVAAVTDPSADSFFTLDPLGAGPLPSTPHPGLSNPSQTGARTSPEEEAKMSPDRSAAGAATSLGTTTIATTTLPSTAAAAISSGPQGVAAIIASGASPSGHDPMQLSIGDGVASSAGDSANQPRRTAGTQRLLADIEGPHDTGALEGTSATITSGRAGKRSISGGRSSRRPSKLVHGGPCAECGTTQSTLFRKNMQGQPLCNACGLRYVRSQTRQQQKHSAEESESPYPRTPGDSASPKGYIPGATRSGRSVAGAAEHSRRGKSSQRRLSLDEQRWCRYCGAVTSPQWRYIDKELACNACALRRHRKAERKDVCHCCQGFVF
jgi:hypothetical protein